MTASKIRDAALYILRCADLPSARRGELLITAGIDPDYHAGASWLRIEADGQIVFRAWWNPDEPDVLAAVVSHGPWESNLLEASNHGW
ncbi:MULTISPECIES: hypothetical protein [unclassified Nitrobacter]|mgnify:FL=1|uniref:hypothetical protein n=1 Tax=unclassified Nitrobacter TaxID=2620411 RepID=UPI001AC218C5|nr:MULTISPECIES: hypothetical protein [unclassified Nitrobacter]MBN9149161.1 hypothetical protein [Nitrobacter sp.]